MEFGAWLSALLSVPAACMFVGASLAILPYTGLAWGAVVGMVAFAAKWVRNCLAVGLTVALPIGVVVWFVRGIAARLGRSAADSATCVRRRRRRWAVTAGLGVLGLVAGIALGTWFIRYSFRKVEEVVAETDDVDPDWRIDDLMANREEIPDEENSARAAAQVVSLLPQNWPPDRPKGAPIDPDVVDAQVAIERADKADESRRLDEESVEALRADLEVHREALELARGLAGYDRGRHEIKLGSTLINTLLPETQAARSVARLLQADAFRLVQHNEPDRAIDSCRAILATARSIGDEPTTISQLVRIAIDSFAARTVRRVLGQGEPSDEALAALQDLVLDERDQPRPWYAYRGDRAMFSELLRRIADGEVPLSALSDSNGSDKGPKREGYLSGLASVGVWYQYSLMLRWFNELVAILDKPEAEWADASAEWHARFDAFRKTRMAAFTATLPILLMPALDAYLSAELRVRSELGALVVLLAAERHRQAHGAWPASAARIDPDILPDPPFDPYGGATYRMEHVDGRLRVYSIGPNLRDEHGSFDPRKWGREATDDDVGTFAYDSPLRGRPAGSNP